MYKKFLYFCGAKAFGVWCSWLAFLHGVQAVARSSRATPTKFSKICRDVSETSLFCLYFLILKKGFIIFPSFFFLG